jgi:hypothetical protein
MPPYAVSFALTTIETLAHDEFTIVSQVENFTVEFNRHK